MVPRTDSRQDLPAAASALAAGSSLDCLPDLLLVAGASLVADPRTDFRLGLLAAVAYAELQKLVLPSEKPGCQEEPGHLTADVARLLLIH